MSTEIDERVVEMRLDNDDFEKNANTSIGTLGKLKNALNFSSSADDLSHLDDVANSMDFSGLQTGLKAVSNQFSALELVGLSVLSNLATQAVNTGINLVKSLSIDNVADGWNKYAEKTTSVATLVAQGYAMETVTDQLERLNWYTDETSYTFTDMVSNIAKFTASGQGLEDSVTAMEGIANWAALSGQNATTASRAMYQLSQAMSSGIMRKEDYKSIQTANMDTQEFRQACLDAAVAMGTLKKNSDDTYSSLIEGANDTDFTISQFADNLTEGKWLTSDVMMKVFNQYSNAVDQIYEYAEKNGVTASEAIELLGDNVDAFGLKAFKAAQEARTFTDVINSVKEAVASGWMQTFEYIFGNYEEARDLWTDLSNELYDVFAESGNTRNEILSTWKEIGGRDDLVGAFWDIWNSIRDVTSLIHKTLQEIFLMSDFASGSLEGFSDLLSPAAAAFEAMDNASEKTMHVLTTNDLGEIIANATSKLKELTHRVKLFIEEITNTDKFTGFYDTINGIGSVLKILYDIITGIGGSLSHIFDGLDGNFFKQLLNGTGGLSSLITSIKNALENSGLLTDIFDKLGSIISKISKFVFGLAGDFAYLIGELGYFISGKISDGTLNFFTTLKDIFDKIVNSNVFKVISEQLTNLVNTITNLDLSFLDDIANVLSGVWSVIKTIGGELWSYISELATKLSETFNANGKKFDINTIFDAATLTSIISLIKKFIETLTDIGDVSWSLEYIGESIGLVFKELQTELNTKVISAIATAVLELAIALLLVASIDTEKLTTSLGAILGLFAELEAFYTSMDKINSVNSKKSSTSITKLISMAASILILAAALKILSTIDNTALGNGLLAIGAIMVEIGTFIYAMQAVNPDSFNKISKNMSKLAIGLLIMTVSIKSLAKLDINSISTALYTIGVVLAEIAAFVGILSLVDPKSFNTVSGATIKLAVGILLLVHAIKKIGEIQDISVIQKGLVTIGILLAEIAAFALIIGNLGGSSLKLAVLGASFIGISVGIVILAAALKILNGVSFEAVAELGAALFTLAAAVMLMSGSLAGAAALLIVSAALIPLSASLKALGKMSLTSIGKSLLVLAGAFVVIGVAAAVLTPFIPTLLTLSALFLAIGVGSALLGVGLVAVAAGFTALATAVSVGGAALVEGLKVVVIGLAEGAVQAVLVFFEGLASFGELIWENLAKFIPVVTQVLMALLDCVDQVIPYGVQVLCDFILSLIMGLGGMTAEIVGGLIQFMVDIIDELSANIGTVINSLINLQIQIINGVADGLRGNSQGLLDAFANLASSIVELFLSILSAIGSKIPIIGDSISEWAENAKSDVQSFFGVEEEYTQKSGKFYKSLTAGADDAKEDITTAMSGLGAAAIKGATESDSTLQSAGSSIIESIKTGISNYTSGSDDALGLSSLLSSDLSTAFSADNTDISTCGMNLMQGLSNGITDNSYLSTDALVTSSDDMMSAFTNNTGINSPSTVMWDNGLYLDQGLANGITENSYIVTEAINSASTSIIEQVRLLIDNYLSSEQESNTSFMATGKALIQLLANGIVHKEKNQDHPVIAAIKQVLDDAIEAIKEKYQDFYDCGKYICEGFVNGINDNAYLVLDAAQALADQVKEIIYGTFEVASPSRVTYALGKFIDMGLSNGIYDYTGTVEDSASYMSDKAISSMRDTISKIRDCMDEDIDYQPTITPVLDLTNLKSSASNISGILGKSSARLASSTNGNFTAYKNSKTNTSVAELQNGSETTGTTVQFTQNNYSPKALSRLEIYRQTRNQLAQMKGLVE